MPKIYTPTRPKTSINEVCQIVDTLIYDLAVLIVIFASIGALLFWAFVFLAPVVEVV